MTISWVVHVVDDEAAVRDAVVFRLDMKGLRAIAYDGAEDFLARGREIQGVLLSDVRMPSINGIELTRTLRRSGSAMPIFLMTGHVSDQLEAGAIDAGADRVFGKPLTWELLLDEIARVTKDWR